MLPTFLEFAVDTSKEWLGDYTDKQDPSHDEWVNYSEKI